MLGFLPVVISALDARFIGLNFRIMRAALFPPAPCLRVKCYYPYLSFKLRCVS